MILQAENRRFIAIFHNFIATKHLRNCTATRKKIRKLFEQYNNDNELPRQVNSMELRRKLMKYLQPELPCFLHNNVNSF